MIKLTCRIFLCVLINQKKFINPLIIFFFTYIKVFQNSSGKCYQNNKERLQKKKKLVI